MPIKPVIQALLLADRVYTDKATGKRVVAGVSNSIAAPEIPGYYDSDVSVFVSLTEVHGEIDVTVRFVDLSNSQVLLEHDPERITSVSPLATLDLIFELPPIPPHEGIFAFEVHSGNELLGSLRVTVRQGQIADAEESE